MQLARSGGIQHRMEACLHAPGNRRLSEKDDKGQQRNTLDQQSSLFRVFREHPRHVSLTASSRGALRVPRKCTAGITGKGVTHPCQRLAHLPNDLPEGRCGGYGRWIELSFAAPSLRFYALPETITRAMHQHIYVGDRKVQSIADFRRFKLLHFAEHEDLPLSGRQTIHTLLNSAPEFLRFQGVQDILGRANPPAIGVKTRLEDFLDRIVLFLAIRFAPTLSEFVVQYMPNNQVRN